MRLCLQDGATLVENLTGEGDRAWSVTRNGTYNLTHTTYTNGVVAAVLNATFTVTGKDEPFPEGDVTVTGYDGKYDGAGHGITVTAPEDANIRYARIAEGPYGANPPFTNVCGATTIWCEVTKAGYIPYTNSATVVISKREVTLTSGSGARAYNGIALTNWTFTVSGDGFVGDEGVTCTYSGTQTAVGSSKNMFDYAFRAGTSADNYTISKVEGTLEVTQGTIGSGGVEEPGTGDVSAGGVSKFDVTCMYDGDGHSVDTNAIVAAFGGSVVGEFTIKFGRSGLMNPPSGGLIEAALPDVWSAEPPVFTNACEEIVWYKVTSANYADYVHAAKVTITNRPVTVMSSSGNWVFDTMAHSTNGVEVAIGGDDAESGGRGATALPTIPLIGDDSIEVNGFPSITDVGSKPNAFNWAFGSGTLATNYCVSVVTGTLTVTARPISDDPANWDIRLGEALKYNGSEQSAPLIQVAFRKPDGNLVDIPYALMGNVATNVGNYKVTITGSGNYAGSVEKDWAIVERNLMFTSMTTNWVYDGVAHTADVVAVSGDGFVAGEGVTFSDFPVVRHVADAATPITNSFTYSWNEGTLAKNYSAQTTFGTVQMAKRVITLTSPTKDKTYDGTALTFNGDEIVATYGRAASPLAAAGDGGLGQTALPSGESFSYSAFASITEVGQKSATFAVADGTALVADYDITPAYGKLTVMANATEITVTAKSQSWVYDGTEHKLNEYDAPNAASVLLPGDALEVTFDPTSVVTTPIDGLTRLSTFDLRSRFFRSGNSPDLRLS